MADITININESGAAKPADVKRDTALGSGGTPGQSKGYNGQVQALGKLIEVKDGVAEMDGKRIFIDAKGRVVSSTPSGKKLIIGHVAPGVLTKGAPPSMQPK